MKKVGLLLLSFCGGLLAYQTLSAHEITLQSLNLSQDSIDQEALSALKAPVGVRPCCAFGVDLKAQLGSVPVPFFSLENVLDPTDIGSHRYNDGSESVSGSLLGFNDERNGIIFTELGGFIDTAHVRDTADYSYYLFQLNRQMLGHNGYLTLPSELKSRRIQWHKQERPLSEFERVERSAQAAALIAFRLAQWHEIAQWFGMVSVTGFKEYASAFSSEDLYSNMLGARLAQEILVAQPNLTASQFSQAMDIAFANQLIKLKAQPKSVTRSKLQQLDGVWWDSDKRLPDKWVVLFRDYHLALHLMPNFSGSVHALSLEDRFADQQRIEEWVSLELHSDEQDSAFSALPNTINQQAIWRPEQFQRLADFAQQVDQNVRP